jgi:hypothetical protein
MKWFLCLSVFISADLFAAVPKECAKDVKKFKCEKLVGGEQEFCLGKNLMNLLKPCQEILKKEIERFKPVTMACRDQMALHCKEYKRANVKKCLADNSKKFVGECGKRINTFLQKK